MGINATPHLSQTFGFSFPTAMTKTVEVEVVAVSVEMELEVARFHAPPPWRRGRAQVWPPSLSCPGPLLPRAP